MRRIIYYGWLGHKNLGDEALFYVNRSIFRKANLVPYGSMLTRFIRPLACIVGGGTYINEYGSVTEIRQIQQSMPFIIFGAGVQNPSYWLTVPGYVDARKTWNEILERSPFVGVRGPLSLQILKDQGFHGAEIIGDPALSLRDEAVIYRTGRRIGLNFGFTDNNLWGHDDDAVYNELRNLVKTLHRLHYNISLFSTYPADTQSLVQMRKDLPEIEGLHIHYKYTPAVLRYFRNIDIFVGMKLHSVVLAHCAYTPSLMIEYRPKCADYMASMGLKEWTVRSDRIGTDNIIDILARLSEDIKNHQEHLFEKTRYFKALQKAKADEIMDYFRRLDP